MTTKQGVRKFKCNPAVSHFCVGKTGRGACVPNSKKCEQVLTGINQTIAWALVGQSVSPLYSTWDDRFTAVKAIADPLAQKIYDRDRNDDEILEYYLIPGSGGKTFNQIAKNKSIEAAEATLRRNADRKANLVAEQKIKQDEIAHEAAQVNGGSDRLLKGRLEAFRRLYPEHTYDLTLGEFKTQSPDKYDRLIEDFKKVSSMTAWGLTKEIETRRKQIYTSTGLINIGDRYLSQFKLDTAEDMDKLRKQLLGNLSYEESVKLVSQKKFDIENVEASDRIKNQAVEFYQMTGGLGASKLDTFGRKNSRAHADPSGFLNVGSDPTHKTIFHEMGHFVEYENRSILNASDEFLSQRATGSRARLQDLAPGYGYGDHEIAFPDHFFDPYVGKIYFNASEVVSMGMQEFRDPESMLRFYRTDPEHFKFTVGIMQAKKVAKNV